MAEMGLKGFRCGERALTKYRMSMRGIRNGREETLDDMRRLRD
jgi:hypothetical protein